MSREDILGAWRFWFSAISVYIEKWRKTTLSDRTCLPPACRRGRDRQA